MASSKMGLLGKPTKIFNLEDLMRILLFTLKKTNNKKAEKAKSSINRPQRAYVRLNMLI